MESDLRVTCYGASSVCRCVRASTLVIRSGDEQTYCPRHRRVSPKTADFRSPLPLFISFQLKQHRVAPQKPQCSRSRPQRQGLTVRARKANAKREYLYAIYFQQLCFIKQKVSILLASYVLSFPAGRSLTGSYKSRTSALCRRRV
jgi:hypothetical protein